MSSRLRPTAVGLALAFAVVLAACSDEAPSTLDPRGPEADRLAEVWWILFGLAAFVYVVVAGFIMVAAFRRSAGDDDTGDEHRSRRFLWGGGVIFPGLVLAVVAFVTIDATAGTRPEDSGEDAAVRIEVTGYRWWWDVRYPDAGVVTANEIHIPVGRPVEVVLRSADVLHSFWVPELAGKLDLVPGQTNRLELQADEPGEYLGECAEFCGIQHANMRFLVIAEETDDFETWLDRRRRPPGPFTGIEAQGEAVFQRSACAGCHTVRGTTATGDLGPDLTDFGSRRMLGAATVPNTRGHLAGWIVDAPSVKPGVLMPPVQLAPDELDAVIAYLEALD